MFFHGFFSLRLRTKLILISYFIRLMMVLTFELIFYIILSLRNACNSTRPIWSCHSPSPDPRTRRAASVSRWSWRRPAASSALVFCPTAITFSVCSAFGSGGWPSNSITRSFGRCWRSVLFRERQRSTLKNSSHNWSISACSFRFFLSQSMPGVPCHIRFCVPQRVLGGHKGGKGEAIDRLSWRTRRKGLQVLQEGRFYWS